MHKRNSIKKKLIILSAVVAIPFLLMVIYLIYALHNYSQAYDAIVSNLTVANNYNLNFKEEMDESLYKLVVGSTTFESIGEDESLKDPYEQLDELESEFQNLLKITADKESRVWLQILLRNVDTLRDRVDDIRMNMEKDGSYDTNIEMLESDIYILTELIQDDIQYYIYYETTSMEYLTQQLNQRVHSFTVICVATIILLSILVVLVVVAIVRNIIKPIDELAEVTEEIAEGNFSVRANINTDDEIAVLADSVNDMSRSLEEMVEKIKADERKMRRADLRLLQEQINPHFLYNTLDTIVWLIEGNSSDKAVNMVMSLSEFFRLVLSKGKEYITIQEEEFHIRSYLEIQQVRYHDILDYEIRIPEELYPYKIIKLTLQPLIENSLYHGIKYKRAKGKITISGNLENGLIHFRVEDNGVGMKPEELEKLQREIQKPCKETEKGFGLANVNERIRMNYGSRFGMTIDSVEGKGTCVEIVIPAEIFSKAGKDENEKET